MEVTCRTIGGLALLRPSRQLSEIVVGVLGRALQVSPLEVCAVFCASNHYHALLVVEDQQCLSRFMAHFQANVAKEAARLIGWTGKVWSRRYDGIVVSDEPKAQWARLKYLLAGGTKEGLVRSPLEWPGLHSARALITGEPLEGCWFSRTQEWAARRRGDDFGVYDYATRYQVELAPLPCFRHLSKEAYQAKVVELIEEIQVEEESARCGRPFLGVDAVLNQNPFESPTRKPKKSPRPKFHVATRKAFSELRVELAQFLLEYREASAALRSGDLEAVHLFPEGSYPPPIPFVGSPPLSPPPRPPTRVITVLENGTIERGNVPVVRMQASWVCQEPRARGQPP